LLIPVLVTATAFFIGKEISDVEISFALESYRLTQYFLTI
jgi:hypothetical protein